MSVIQFSSKKKRRLAERDARRVRAVNARLNRIMQLAKLLKNDHELDLLLQSIPDDALRAETRKLIEPFCLFKIQRVELITAPDGIDVAATPEKATQVVLQ